MDPNERLTGLASLGPSGGGQPPMPPMGGGQPPMPEPGMGEMAMQGQPMQEEAGMDLEQDSAMLAEAVVGRAQGDIGAAIAVLDNAKAMLISAAEGGGQEPQAMMNGGPLYREGGGSMSDSDMLRQMIMQSLQGQTGRSVSDADLKMIPSLFQKMTGENVPASFYENRPDPKTQTGRSMSDKDSLMLSDAEKFSNLLKSMR